MWHSEYGDVESIEDALSCLKCAAVEAMQKLTRTRVAIKYCRLKGRRTDWCKQSLELKSKTNYDLACAIRYIFDHYEDLPETYKKYKIQKFFKKAYEWLAAHKDYCRKTFPHLSHNNVLVQKPGISNDLQSLAVGVSPAIAILGQGLVYDEEQRIKLQQAIDYLDQNFDKLPGIIPPCLSGIPAGIGLLGEQISLADYFKLCIENLTKKYNRMDAHKCILESLSKLQTLYLRSCQSNPTPSDTVRQRPRKRLRIRLS